MNSIRVFFENLLSLLLLFFIAFLVSSCNKAVKEKAQDKKPNILLIFTDQQNSHTMSTAGNPYLNTPNMDQLAKEGVMFAQAYCTSPVCGPARSSIISGRMPHETGVEWNRDSMKDEVVNPARYSGAQAIKPSGPGNGTSPRVIPNAPHQNKKK
jgi:predicted AlkP superfamily pyrophosphatase or phosphodiesterase